MDELDALQVDHEPLFADQSLDNICDYSALYLKVEALVDSLEKANREWREITKRNTNDKVFRVYAATVQLALHTIFSRHMEFLPVLSFWVNGQAMCGDKWQAAIAEYIEQKGGFDEAVRTWEDKASSSLAQAKESVSKALAIDPDYTEAHIVEAQILAISGEYAQAVDKLNQLNELGYFKESRAFLNSWLAYINLQKQKDNLNALSLLDAKIAEGAGKKSFGADELRLAAAYVEPLANKSWATKVRRILSSVEEQEMRFDFIPVEGFLPNHEVDLNSLKKLSEYVAGVIRGELAKPTDQRKGIRKPLTTDFKKNPDKYILSHEYVLSDLATDTSLPNLDRYIVFIDDLYKAGVVLDHLTQYWDILASKNKEADYYYLAQKVKYIMVLLDMVNQTEDLVADPKLQERMRKRHEELEVLRKRNAESRNMEYFERIPVDYHNKWLEWQDKFSSFLRINVEKVKDEMVAGHFLDFEYAAAFGETDLALKKLKYLEERFSEYKLLVSPDGFIAVDFPKQSLNGMPQGDVRWDICAECATWEDEINKINFIEKASIGVDYIPLEMDLEGYVAAWKSYLEHKRGNHREAGDNLLMAKRYPGMEEWKTYQEQVLYLEKMLAEEEK
ncbi:MAG: hypothetical protein RQ753_00475 [Desulfurivibrionaceae bacterium]|nr:hypothetical protein [Desulfobulbales bacterium]MDT8334150.1 hypothetical protein [Desulfurivibrionaceae bacterium]